MKTGFIGIIGRPNVGKSTLLNSILGEKIAITTDKPQTTRNTIRGIYTRSDVQMVFIDTPGIHKPHSKLGAYMTESAVNTFKEVDVILFLVDSDMSKGPGDKYILEMLKDVHTPKILVINKIDTMEPEYFRRIYDEYSALGIFEDVFGTSALEGRNVDRLIGRIEDFLQEGPMFFPEDMVTDHPERFIVSEIIREKLLLYLNDEVPHGVYVEVDKMKFRKTKEKENIYDVSATIYCLRDSHKGIIIGKNGQMLKKIGTYAREDLEKMLLCFIVSYLKVKDLMNGIELRIMKLN